MPFASAAWRRAKQNARESRIPQSGESLIDQTRELNEAIIWLDHQADPAESHYVVRPTDVRPTPIILRRRTADLAQTPCAVGATLSRMARTVFGRGANERIFSPIVADLQFEHHMGMESGNQWEARFALARGYLAFWRAVAKHVGLMMLLRTVTKIRKLL